MSHLKVRGFVIRVIPFGESDRIVSILTAEHGLLRAFARGARRSRSLLRLATQDFVLCDFELFHYKDRLSIDGAQLVEPFMTLQQDMDRLVCAAHLAEVLYDAVEHDTAQPECYSLWGYSLQALQTHPDPLLVVHTAQLRLLGILGLAPRLDSCVACSRPLDLSAQPLFFSVRLCGLICDRPGCRDSAADLRHLASGTAACLRHSLQAPFARLFNYSLEPAVRQTFFSLSLAYLIHQMEKPYSRLQMAADLSNFQINQES